MTAATFKSHGQSSGDAADSSTPYPYATLAEYLWRTPFIFNGRFDDDTRAAIIAECYQSLWQHNPALMPKYFFATQKDFQDAIHAQLNSMSDDDPFLVWHTNGIVPAPDLSNEHGRQCGRVFRKGEPVYRCRKDISPGSGGCCDCGDPEAWKVPLQCSIHSAFVEPDEAVDHAKQVSSKVLDAIRASISSALDFILDTFALGPQDISLSASTSELLKDNGSNKISVRLDDPILDNDKDVDMDQVENEQLFASKARSIPQSLETENDTVEEYVCIAWNDEGHAFSHVLECIMAATGCEWERAKQVVDSIHLHGREIIAVSTSMEQLRKVAQPLAAINLGVTIKTARDVYRENVCSLLVFWLKELVHGCSRFFSDYPNGDAIVRTIVCEELCTEWKSRSFPRDDMFDDNDDMNEDLMGTTSTYPAAEIVGEDIDMFDPETSIKEQSSMHKTTNTDIATIDWDPAAMIDEFQSLRTEELLLWEELMTNVSGKGKSLGAAAGKRIAPEMMPSAIQREFEKRLRLDYLLLSDLKLWKEMRVALRELYITSLIADTAFRKVLGRRLARNYARLAESFLLKDREPESSIILFSVQLLTVPSVADLLVNQYDFFGLICSSLTAFFLTDRLYLVLPSERKQYPARVNCESRAFRTRRYFNAFHDLRYIMNVDMIKSVLAQDPLYLRQFLDLIGMFQCMNAQLCQKDAHVEYESEIWVNAFNVTLQLGKCCRQFAACFGKLSFVSDRVSATRTIVRAITRILKKIDDWGTEPDDIRSVDDNISSTKKIRPPTQQPGVSGPGEQDHHIIQLPYTDQPIKVLKYDITSQPVSFHHPLHWLLAFVLEHISAVDEDMLIEAGFPGGFQQIFTLFKADDVEKATPEALLPIIEFPIRTIAFSAQIRAGVWVRNGYGIRNQALHYRDVSLRENTYDADMFLLQLAFASVDSNQLLTTLMDRFGLVTWFLGNRDHTQYDAGQSTFMVEELLNLLIVCACERSNITCMSIEDRIRREIIHSLCLNPIAYSELIKRIPDRLHEHVSFDHLLSELGQFKAPTGVNDTGTYSLKEEYFRHVDPYFYHYSRNNREEAIDMLKKRWKQANPSTDANNFFLLPTCTKIASGAFRYLGDFLHCTVFTQMMAYVFWNVRRNDNHKSDTNLEQALHLILVALTDENNRTSSIETSDDDDPERGGFYRYVCDNYFAFAGDDHTQDLSLFDIMSIFRDDEDYKELHTQLDWIFEQLLTRGPGRTRRKVQKWKDSKTKTESEESAEKYGISEQQAKKLAAKERQMKIMAQFAQAQSQFIELNEDLYDEEDEDEDEQATKKEKEEVAADDTPQDDGKISRLCTYPTGTCIVCQEEVSEKSAPYGLLALIQTSNIIREAHQSQESAVLSKFKSNGGSLDTEWPDEQELLENESNIPGLPAHMNKTGLYASTCSHLMHIQCFEVYCSSIDSRHSAQLTRNHPENRSRNEFMCPLCKSLGNILLPVYWKGRKETFPGIIQYNESSKFYNFLQFNVQQGIDRLKQAIINRSQSQRRRSSGSKLKEAFAAFVPTLRTMPPGTVTTSTSASTGTSSQGDDEWQGVRRPPITNIELSLHEGSTSTPIMSSSSVSSGSMLPGNVFPYQRFGPFDSDIMHPSTSSNLTSVSKMYVRVFEVISTIYKEICSEDAIREMSTNAKNVDLLWGLLGYTVAGVEIATRGAQRPSEQSEGYEFTDSLFDQIPQQTRMLLRILCDSILAYTCIMCHHEPGTSISSSYPQANTNQTLIRVHLLALARLRQVFADIQVGDFAHLQGLSYERTIVYDNLPLLQDDPFMVLAELTFHGIPFAKMSVHILMRVLLLAELTKTVVSVVQDRVESICSSQDSDDDEESDDDMDGKELSEEQVTAIRDFVLFVMDNLKFSEQEAQAVYEAIGAEKLYKLLQSFALPFLRRSMILMIVRYGYIPTPKEHLSDANEFDRLLNLLWLPDLTELLQLESESEQLVSSWCSQHVSESERAMRLQPNASRLLDITLDLPTPLHLISLPKKLEQLIDESMRRICTKCGSVPSDPAVCLLCGTFVCAQSFCCAEDEEGECNLHSLECGGEIGLYLSVKRCVVILLHNGNGWFVNAPYLDPHGEVDQGLR
ncbi:hypothetical protein BJV82DRAFT_645135 [Fennellomyces sp. T-0311]|nr:hypothetical protein BJV82DRAFT_645135 [Fennellomyces sp. T-0311]